MESNTATRMAVQSSKQSRAPAKEARHLQHQTGKTIRSTSKQGSPAPADKTVSTSKHGSPAPNTAVQHQTGKAIQHQPARQPSTKHGSPAPSTAVQHQTCKIAGAQEGEREKGGGGGIDHRLDQASACSHSRRTSRWPQIEKRSSAPEVLGGRAAARGRVAAAQAVAGGPVADDGGSGSAPDGLAGVMRPVGAAGMGGIGGIGGTEAAGAAGIGIAACPKADW